MFPPFNEESAFIECQKIISDIQSEKIKIKQVSNVSKERENQGFMIGSLVCKDSSGKEVVLITISGIGKELILESEDTRIFVFPIVSFDLINSALDKNDRKIHELTDEIRKLKSLRKKIDGSYFEQTEKEKNLCELRSSLTNESLLNVYNLYSFSCIDGKEINLLDICNKKLPPTGTGDCCAPKLFNYAFKNSLFPISLAEVFYGLNDKNKISGKKYPPCDERCSLILPRILGLDILYRDEYIVVVNKQSGVLSVPGRGSDKQDCIVNRLKRLFPNCIEQPSVHRLDMETSGLLVLAFTKEAHRDLNKQFENKEVKKQYIAVIDGILDKSEGEMELYFRVDIDNRPHQIWDEVYGKKAITQWHIIDTEVYTAPDGEKKNVTRVLFVPLTGRTHQLRLAAADSHGFSKPIIGDTLYGVCKSGERLLLHSSFLSFSHPITKEKMEFTSKPDF